eukprot:6007967-Pleurochrysis_carterae.AAC.1
MRRTQAARRALSQARTRAHAHALASTSAPMHTLKGAQPIRFFPTADHPSRLVLACTAPLEKTSLLSPTA